LYVHVCKLETLRAAYAMAQMNDGAPGLEGVTFAAIEAQGVEAFLVQIRDELVGRTYVPLPARRQEIPKDGGIRALQHAISLLICRLLERSLSHVAPMAECKSWTCKSVRSMRRLPPLYRPPTA
jgi:hypothetical protein